MAILGVDVERQIHPYAIADAMITAQYNFIKHVETGPNVPLSELELALIEKSVYACTGGSATVLSYLATNYALDFDLLLMLGSENPIKPFKDPKFRFHRYFLVRGLNDIWYAGSPANYSEGNLDNLTRVIASPKVDQVLELIQDIEEGTWSDTAFILEESQRFYKLPILGKSQDTQSPFVTVSYAVSEHGTNKFFRKSFWLMGVNNEVEAEAFTKRHQNNQSQ